MPKKIAAILLSIALCVSVAGCASTTPSPEANPGEQCNSPEVVSYDRCKTTEKVFLTALSLSMVGLVLLLTLAGEPSGN